LDQEWANGQNGIKRTIIITTISWDASGVLVPATIDFKEGASWPSYSRLQLYWSIKFEINCQWIFNPDENQKMRCGILVNNNDSSLMEHIVIDNITVYDVFIWKVGFKEGKKR
jgi:hypothetical protein